MNQTFPYRLVELQKDPDYFTPDKLAELKVVFDRVCDELNLGDIYKDPRQRDQLAIIILVRAKAYHSENEMVEAAIAAIQLHMGPRRQFTP